MYDCVFEDKYSERTEDVYSRSEDHEKDTRILRNVGISRSRHVT